MSEKINTERIRENFAKITFDEELHRYIVGGKVLPSVTQIMKPLTEEKYANIDKSVLMKASDRGTRVHKAIEMYEQFGIDTTDLEIKPYLTQYKIAKRLEKFEVLENELMMTNFEFCGTLDIVGTLDDKIILVDLKATSQINTDLLEVQLAGYDELARFNGIEPQGYYVLHLTKKNYKFKPISLNELLWEMLKGDYGK